MADDLEAELSALENDAPLTDDTTDDDDFGPGNPKPSEDDEGKPGAKAKDGEPGEEWKPPTKEHWENSQKALRAEREEKRRLAQQARLQEQNLAVIEQRVQTWQQQMMAQQLQAPAPDPYENPDQARARLAQQQHMLQQLHYAEQQRQQHIAHAQEQERQFQHVSTAVDDFESEFKATHPDYDDATDHMLGIQQKILEGMGYPPEEAQRQVGFWSLSVAQQALRSGRNPAQVAYELAGQMGYRPKGTDAEAAAAKLAAIKAGQGSAQTLSGGGAGGRGGTSLKQIAGLEGAAFDSAMEKYLNDSIRGR